MFIYIRFSNYILQPNNIKKNVHFTSKYMPTEQ